MKDEISFLRNNKASLFDSLTNLTLHKEPIRPTVKDGVDAAMRLVTLEDDLRTIGNVVGRLGGSYSRLVHAFHTNKKLHRASIEEITSNKENISDIYHHVADNKEVVSELQKECLDVKSEQNLIQRSNEKITSNIADIYQRIDDNKKEIFVEISVLVKEVEKMLSRKFNVHNVPVRTTEQLVHNVPVTTTEQPAQTFLVCGKVRGVRSLYVDSISSSASVYCDKEADGEVWITFMRRENGQVSFTRSWAEYKHGFGKADGEFWSGNEALHQLTADKSLRLRIDMADVEGNKAFAEYETFQVGPEGDKYRLTVAGYSGNAGDSLTHTTKSHSHNGMMFSTFDSDNDKSNTNCGRVLNAGWWFNSCFMSNLNGLYRKQSRISRNSYKGIHWCTWSTWNKSLKSVEMKVR